MHVCMCIFLRVHVCLGGTHVRACACTWSPKGEIGSLMPLCTLECGAFLFSTCLERSSHIGITVFTAAAVLLPFHPWVLGIKARLHACVGIILQLCYLASSLFSFSFLRAHEKEHLASY